MNKKGITIYCASSPDAPEKFLNAAYELGKVCAETGLASITGAGMAGLMGEVVRGTLSVPGAEAVGVIPQFMVDRGWANPAMTELYVTDSMHSRKEKLAELGCGAIALPGGIGTLDELMDLLALCQLGLYKNPVVILNIDGFYDNLLAQLAHADSCSMMRHMGLPGNLWLVATSPAEAVSLILGNGVSGD